MGAPPSCTPLKEVVGVLCLGQDLRLGVQQHNVVGTDPQQPRRLFLGLAPQEFLDVVEVTGEGREASHRLDVQLLQRHLRVVQGRVEELPLLLLDEACHILGSPVGGWETPLEGQCRLPALLVGVKGAVAAAEEVARPRHEALGRGDGLGPLP